MIVPDFSVMTEDEANGWAKLNNVNLTIQEKYSTVGKGVFISQGTTSGTSIQEGGQIIATYSLGRVPLSSFIGRTKLDMLDWQSEINSKGGRINISFSEAYGSKGTAGKIISQSVENDYISPGTAVKAVVSLGMKLLSPDFTGKTEDECASLAQSAGIDVIFDYQGSGSIDKGYVISQNPAANTVITDADKITVVVSTSDHSNTKITVPDFSLLTKEEANEWALRNNISLSIKDTYSASEPLGLLFGQSVASGESIAADRAINIQCSLGEIAIASFIGKTKLEVQNWLSEVNSKGGNLSVNYTYAHDESLAMNIVVDQSVMNTYIDPGTKLIFQISWDPMVP